MYFIRSCTLWYILNLTSVLYLNVLQKFVLIILWFSLMHDLQQTVQGIHVFTAVMEIPVCDCTLQVTLHHM